MNKSEIMGLQFLPDCKGPKLNRFVRTESPIEFVRLLSGNDGVHSHVFQVTIDSKQYALKLVRSKQSLNARVH